MPISLPDNPTDGQTVQIGTIIYTYDATVGVWNSNSAVGPTLTPATVTTDVLADMAALIAKTGMSNGDQAFVTGNNNLYIYSGSGWYKIATVQNDSPSAITGVNGTYELAIDGTATTITAVSTDPEGFPLTWSYSTSGLGSIATVSHNDGVFTITPSTTEADAGTFTLTINATDGVNGAVSTSTNLTLEFIVTVTNSNHTTLLVTATGTSDNNNITDSSSNSHSITVNGDAYAGTFSPYRSGGYSLYFDGTGGDYVRSPTHADFGFSTDDFTIECWYYPVSKAQNYPRIWNFGPYWSNANSLSFLDRHNTWSTTFALVAFSGGEILNSTTTVENNTWYHLTVERSGTTITLYVNGVAEDTYNIGTSQFITSSTSYVTLGNVSDGGNYSEAQAHGYIRDFRYVKGTAIYNGNFTPTTEPLAEVTNTKLFTAHLPYIIDGSNNHSFTIAGTPYTKPFSPYDYLEYSATDYGGSVYFDGTGDYIDTNSAINLSSGGCIEGWVYITSATNYAFFIASTQGAGSFTPRWYVGHSNATDWRCSPGDATDNNITSYDLIKNQWNHFVLSNDGSRSRLFASGVLIFTKSVTPLNENLTFTLSKYGSSAQYLMTGNLSDVRVNTSIPTEYQTSSTTVGASIFTPPTAPLSSSGSELHIKGTDASIIDKSQGANLKLVGDTTGSTTQAKFADTKSMYFDGSDDYIIGPTISDLNIGTGDFTVECWLYETTTNTNKGIWDGRSTGITTDGFTFTRIGTDTFRVWSGSALITTGSFTIQNTWNHCALVRNSGTLTIYINGTSSGTPVSNSTNFSSSGTLIIGAGRHSTGSNPTAFITGYIQDLRVNNYARYTTNFTPPTAPLEG